MIDQSTSSRQPVRVMLVDDSELVLAILRRLLEPDPEIRVVATARNGEEALSALPGAGPDVICTDLHMPRMDGFELIRRVMRDSPRPVLVISASVQEDDRQNVFTALESGAVDVFPKPAGGFRLNNDGISEALRRRVKLLAGVSVFARRSSGTAMPVQQPVGTGRSPAIIGIGASTGGPEALVRLLRPLRAAGLPPIVCVQHIDSDFLPGLVDWLNQQCAVTVKIADAHESAQPGIVYFPAVNCHLRIDSRWRLCNSEEPARGGHRPSVDVLFESLAENCGARALVVLLTGMGSDGAAGMLAVRNAGGATIAQDQASCVVFGMPHEAIELGAAQRVLSLDRISAELQAAGMRGTCTADGGERR